MWTLLFILVLTALFSAPLAPAVIEWLAKRDAAPLRVVREYDGNVAHFAHRFRQFLNENFNELAALSAGETECREGVLSNGNSYQIVGYGGQPVLDENELKTKSTSKVILAQTPLQLPTGVFFESEIYAAQGIVAASWNVFRAILSEQDVTLGEGCDLMRWLHGESTVSVGPHCRLYGRVSAAQSIQIAAHTMFTRMHAPSIVFGAEVRPIVSAPASSGQTLSRPERLMNDSANRWLVKGNWKISPAMRHTGNLVATGRLIIGSGTHITGSVKAERHVRVEDACVVEGSAVAGRKLHIARRCRIAGPIVGEREVFIQSGSVIGSPDRPTTVTAPVIRIEEGAVVYGTVWAKESGHVVPAAPERQSA